MEYSSFSRSVAVRRKLGSLSVLLQRGQAGVQRGGNWATVKATWTQVAAAVHSVEESRVMLAGHTRLGCGGSGGGARGAPACGGGWQAVHVLAAHRRQQRCAAVHLQLMWEGGVEDGTGTSAGTA